VSWALRGIAVWEVLLAVGRKRSSVSIGKLKSSRNGGDVMLAHNIGIGIGVLEENEYTPLCFTTHNNENYHPSYRYY
jgi:hypothetical protein